MPSSRRGADAVDTATAQDLVDGGEPVVTGDGGRRVGEREDLVGHARNSRRRRRSTYQMGRSGLLAWREPDDRGDTRSRCRLTHDEPDAIEADVHATRLVGVARDGGDVPVGAVRGLADQFPGGELVR